MCQELRTVCYDQEIQAEAYRFQGIMQSFPNHFHEYYVIGFVEKGRRQLSCKNQQYIIEAGDMVLFNPGDNHACQQVDEEPLDWRCLNIEPETMAALVGLLPVFTATVIPRADEAARLQEVHQMIMDRRVGIEKEEAIYFLVEELINAYTSPATEPLQAVTNEILKTCAYIEENYAAPIVLKELCEISGLKKYTLLRHFTRQRGITPYQYLETVRVNAAKRLMEKGYPPVEAAVQTGFTDQSHFTHFFKNYIGLTPGQYRTIFKD